MTEKVEPKTDAKHTSQFPNESFYQGEWKDGLKHGTGKYLWPNGSFYEGEWKDGKRNGILKRMFNVFRSNKKREAIIEVERLPNEDFSNLQKYKMVMFSAVFSNRGSNLKLYAIDIHDSSIKSSRKELFDISVQVTPQEYDAKEILLSLRTNTKNSLSTVWITEKLSQFQLLKHKHIFQYLASGDCGPVSNYPLFLPEVQPHTDTIRMERWPGQPRLENSLHHFLKVNKLETDRILTVTSQILDGLTFLHSQTPAFVLENLESRTIAVMPDQHSIKICHPEDVALRKQRYFRLCENWMDYRFTHPDLLRHLNAHNGQYPSTLECYTDIWSLGCIILDMWTQGKVRHVKQDGILLGSNISKQTFMDSVFNCGRPQILLSAPVAIKEMCALCFRQDSKPQYTAEQLLEFLQIGQVVQPSIFCFEPKTERENTAAQIIKFYQIKQSITDNENVAPAQFGCFCDPEERSCQFQYTCLLGNGGYGVVYSIIVGENKIPEMAPYDHNKETLALKYLYTYNLDEKKMENLLRFDNENVVKYISIGKLHVGPDNFKYKTPQTSIIMEYHEGVTLKSLAKEQEKERAQQLKEAVILSYTLQMVNGIKYLHGQSPHPFIHGDIKGDNCLLTNNKKFLKIIDLDSCIQLEGKVTRRSDVKGQVGTMYHMSPEMLNLDPSTASDEPVGRKTDIWSLGCTILEIYGKSKVPYVDKDGKPLGLDLDYDGFKNSVNAGSSPDISPNGPTSSMSLGFREVIKACLQKDPISRPNVSELLTLIRTVISNLK